VSGIGPTLAIKILSGMPADEMVGAIRGGDLVRLTRSPGIGRKTALRLTYHLLRQPAEQSRRLANALETLADRRVSASAKRCFIRGGGGHDGGLRAGRIGTRR